jgi:transcription elongation factor Elf1
MKYGKEITCPFCGHKGNDFKMLNEWMYTYLFVNYLNCQKCKNNFRINWGQKEDCTDIEHYIPRLRIQ